MIVTLSVTVSLNVFEDTLVFPFFLVYTFCLNPFLNTDLKLPSGPFHLLLRGTKSPWSYTTQTPFSCGYTYIRIKYSIKSPSLLQTYTTIPVIIPFGT